MLSKKLLIIFLLLSLSGLASAETFHASGSTQDIKDKIDQASSGDTIIVDAGTYPISEQLVIKEGVTLEGETDEDGNLLTILFLEDDSNFDMQEPLVLMKSNTKIEYLSFNGNSEHQANVPVKREQQWGNGYHNFIGAYYEDDLEVAYCIFYNNLGDGFRPRSCKNVKFHHNSASKGGHDVLFAIQCENVEAYENYIEPRVNSAFRFMDVTNGAIYNNTIVFQRYVDGVRSAAGPAIQIQNDKGTMNNIEVCGNYIYDSWGPAFWIVGKTKTHEQDVWIHHNVMYSAGGNINIYWVGGVIASGYDNILIENNVFDGSFLGAVNFWAYSGAWATEATATLQNNIFTNSVPGVSSGVGGWGVNNEISVQSVVSSDNCYFNNEAGNTRGCSVSSTDYFSDPKSEDTLCDIKWSGSEWIIPGITPKEFDRAEGVYDGVEEITYEEIEEFDSIFDVFNLEFTDNAYIEQGVLNPNMEWENKGKYTKAWIDVPGYEGQLHIGNTTYIPKSPDECAIVLYGTENLADRPVSQIATKDLYMEEGNLTVKLTVKTKYEIKVYKVYNVLGQKIKIPYYKTKTETVTFKKTFVPPNIFPVFEPPKVYVTYYNNSHAIVYTPKIDGIVRVDTSYNQSKCTERRLIGYIGTAENGFRSTDYERIDSWAFSGVQMSQSPHGVYIEGVFDIDKLNVTVTTPYNSFEIEEFEYKIIEDDSRKIINYALFAFVGCIFIYGRAILKIMYMFVWRFV